VLAPPFLTLHLSGRSAAAHVSFPYQTLPSSLAIIKQISLKKASNNRSVYTTLSVSSRFLLASGSIFVSHKTISSQKNKRIWEKITDMRKRKLLACLVLLACSAEGSFEEKNSR
jgi:translation elongation factor EF-Ts